MRIGKEEVGLLFVNDVILCMEIPPPKKKEQLPIEDS